MVDSFISLKACRRLQNNQPCDVQFFVQEYPTGTVKAKWLGSQLKRSKNMLFVAKLLPRGSDNFQNSL